MTFLLQIFNFDMKTIAWNEYIEIIVLGIKQYLMKDRLENLDKARWQATRYVRPYICPFVSSSVHLSVRLSVRPFVDLSFCQFVRPSIFPSLYSYLFFKTILCIHLFIHHHVPPSFISYILLLFQIPNSQVDIVYGVFYNNLSCSFHPVVTLPSIVVSCCFRCIQSFTLC